MIKLIIRHKGKILQEKSLQSDVEYTIGRGKDNNIVLPEEPGISRQHLILAMKDDSEWTVKNLSQACELIIEEEAKEEGFVPLNGSFQVQDFQFTLKEEKTADVDRPKPKEPEAEKEESNIPAGYKTESQIDAVNDEIAPDEKSEGDSSALPAFISPNDKTRVMDMSKEQQKLSAYLKVSYSDDTPRDIFKLEGQSEWIFGRDNSADIMVDNSNISRKHFKISKHKEQYRIEDLNSSNRTILNDKELSPGKAYPIQSGDTIYIIDIEIVFEIKNLSLEKEVARLKAPPPPVPVSALPEGGLPVQAPAGGPVAPYFPTPMPAHLPGVVMEMPEEISFLKKNKKRLIVYSGVIVLILSFVFFNREKKSEEIPDSAVAVSGELAGLSTQQGQIVKDTYQMAQQLYSQGKFEYCKSEVRKIHEYIDSYQDSKKLEIACSQAAENQRRQHDLEQKRLKAEQTEKFIQKVTDNCAQKFDQFNFKHELVACLNSAIELSPADSRIHALTERFDAIEMEKEEQKNRIAKRRKMIQSIVSKYNYAKSLYKTGKVLKSISAYQHFINISNYKELNEKRKTAKRELTSIKKHFNDTNNKMNNECEGRFNAGRFQKAYYICETASRKIPTPHNKKALALMSQSKQKLEITMKPIYEEASLNESVGNVSIAKEYWRKILNQDIKNGLYYKRAKEKLNKY